MTAVPTLKQKIDQAHVIAFRRSLFQRWVEGDHFIVGDHRMYHDGYGISERKVKPADYQAVREALCEAARRTVFCAHCGAMGGFRPVTCCCNIPAFDGSLTFSQIVDEVRGAARELQYQGLTGLAGDPLPQNMSIDAVGWIKAHQSQFHAMVTVARECQHKNTKTNTAGSPVCQECGQSW